MPMNDERQAATPAPAEPTEEQCARWPAVDGCDCDRVCARTHGLRPEGPCAAAPATPAAQPADGWIAVADRLPEPATDVLVYVNDRRICVAGIFNGFWQSLDRPWRGMSVTHWRPLPAAPALEGR